jgi:hypothetical protein
MYPFLVFRLMRLFGQDHEPSFIPPEKNFCDLYTKLDKPHGSIIQVRRREKFLTPNGIHITDGSNCRFDWEIKGEFRICGWKQTAYIRALQQHRRAKNARTMKYVNRTLAES